MAKAIYPFLDLASQKTLSKASGVLGTVKDHITRSKDLEPPTNAINTT